MAMILNFPIYKTSTTKNFISRKEQFLINFPVKPSISEKLPDWDEQIFETELESIRAKCTLRDSDINLNTKQTIGTKIIKTINLIMK